MTVTVNYEVEFGGVKIADGNNKIVMNLAPFESPEIRTSDRNRGQIDGVFPGVDLYGGRTIEMEIELWGDTEADFYTAYSTVLNACVRGAELPLEFKLPGWSTNLISFVRCRKVSGLVIDQTFDLSKGTCVIQFVSTDPRLYEAIENSSVVELTGSQPGRTYNKTYSRTYGGIIASNLVNATNLGNYETGWEATIAGPVTNPAIEHVGQGKLVSIQGSLLTGESLVITSPPYSTIMLGGTSSRYSWLSTSSSWFMLSPGSNNIRFNGSSAGTPTMTFTWRSAWV